MKLAEKNQEHELFVAPEMNRNILDRDCLQHFGVHMYYDLGCIRISKSYVKMEEDIHISSLAILRAHTIIRLQTGKFYLCIAKGNEQLLNSKFHQVIPIEDSIVSQKSVILAVNSIVKTCNKVHVNSQCSLLTILINLFCCEREAPLQKLQKIIVAIDHRETVESLVKQNVDLFADKDTDLGKTNRIKMSIDTIRFCTDFRKLNNISKKSSWPLP